MEFRAIRPKICGNFQFTKNFITQEIRRKSRILRCERMETIIYSLIMKVLWSSKYHKIEGNILKAKYGFFIN